MEFKILLLSCSLIKLIKITFFQFQTLKYQSTLGTASRVHSQTAVVTCWSQGRAFHFDLPALFDASDLRLLNFTYLNSNIEYIKVRKILISFLKQKMIVSLLRLDHSSWWSMGFNQQFYFFFIIFLLFLYIFTQCCCKRKFT